MPVKRPVSLPLRLFLPLGLAGMTAASLGQEKAATRPAELPPADTKAGPDDSDGSPNELEDPTRRVTRLDIRLKYQDLKNDRQTEIVTLRADHSIGLDGGWSILARSDLPLTTTDVVSADNPDGQTQFGTGDLLLQMALVTPPVGPEKRWAVGAGARLMVPTASQDEMGSGKWQLGPVFAARMFLPEVSKGSFVALVVRPQFSFAGDDNRRDISDLFVQPYFSWNLPANFYLQFAPEMKFNLSENGRAFVPFDIQVGKKLASGIVASVQFDVPIVDDLKQYDWQVEFRIGFYR